MKKITQLLNGLPITITITTNDGYWSITGTYDRACGCIHSEILQARPDLAPIVAIHLSDANTGQPMHAEANGWYWIAGALGGLGERFHGANDSQARSQTDCATILAKHLRTDNLTTTALLANIQQMHTMFGTEAARNWWKQWVQTNAPTWKKDNDQAKQLLDTI